MAKSKLSTAHCKKNQWLVFVGVTSSIKACRMAGETLKERVVSRLEEMVGDWSSEDDTVSAWAAYVSNELDVQKDLA